MARKVVVDWAPADTVAALHAQYRAEPAAIGTRTCRRWTRPGWSSRPTLPN